MTDKLIQGNVELRFLKEQDAYTSVKWRNIPKIWELTVSQPDREITIEDELQWIRKVIREDNSCRFAILYKKNYVGNIQLTHIENDESYYGIFIGELNFWGKGIAKIATKLILKYAFSVLKLSKVKLRVRINNTSAYKVYLHQGFEEVHRDNELIYMEMSSYGEV